MINITNGQVTKTVTNGAYKAIYKAHGFTPVVASVGVKKDEFEEMTVAEMKVYAEENEIDLGGATKKGDILEALKVGKKIEPEDEMDEWSKEQMLTPIANWTKADLAKFVKENDIDTAEAKNVEGARAIVKAWIEDKE